MLHYLVVLWKEQLFHEDIIVHLKRAQFPSKTCTRTDYSLLTWFFKSLVRIIVLFCFVCFQFLLSFPHCHCRGRKQRGHQNNILGRHTCTLLLIFTTGITNDITQETGIKNYSDWYRSSLEYLVSKVKKSSLSLNIGFYQTPCPVEDSGKYQESKAYAIRKSRSRF